MVDIVTKLLLLLSPIVYGAHININYFDIRFFEIGIIALFVASLFDKPKREIGKFNLPISLLLGLLVVNSFWHKFQPQDTRAIGFLFFGILGFVIMTKYLKSPQSCYKYIFWALGINLGVLVLQRIGYDPIFNYSTYCKLPGGMLRDIVRFSTYLALILPYLPLTFAVILAFLFGIFLCYAQISLLIPISLMIFFRTKDRLYRFLTILAGIAIIITFHGKIWTSILLRCNIWKPAIKMFFERPLLGWGFGTYQLWTGTESFNSYLPFIYGLGFLGLIWLGWLGREFKKRFEPNKENIAVLSLACVSLIEYPFEIPRLWFTIIAILSFYAIKQIERLSNV